MKDMNQRITDARNMFNIALTDAELQKELNAAGYSPEKLQTMCGLIDQVTALNAVQAREYAEQLYATDGLDEKTALADKAYMRIVKLSRVAFADNTLAQKELELFGRRKAAAGAWYNQAELFYQGLLNQPAYQKPLAELGITKDEIEKGYRLLKDIPAAKLTQKQETAQAIQATAARDAELEKLDQEYSSFKKVCRVIFEGDKESLKKLGL